MYHVTKRDGSIVAFDINKITTSITRAFDTCERRYHPTVIDMLALNVTAGFEPQVSKGQITAPTIQDKVEEVLTEAGYPDVAQAYITHRRQRERAINARTTPLDQRICPHCGADTTAYGRVTGACGPLARGASIKAREYCDRVIYDLSFTDVPAAYGEIPHREGGIERVHDEELSAPPALFGEAPVEAEYAPAEADYDAQVFSGSKRTEHNQEVTRLSLDLPDVEGSSEDGGRKGIVIEWVDGQDPDGEAGRLDVFMVDDLDAEEFNQEGFSGDVSSAKDLAEDWIEAEDWLDDEGPFALAASAATASPVRTFGATACGAASAVASTSGTAETAATPLTIAAEGVLPEGIYLVTEDACHKCMRLKSMLEEANIDYVEVPTYEYASLVQALGVATVPTLIVSDGTTYQLHSDMLSAILASLT